MFHSCTWKIVPLISISISYLPFIMVTVIVGNNCPEIRTIALLKWLQCDRMWCDGIHIASSNIWLWKVQNDGSNIVFFMVVDQEHGHISCHINIVEQRIWFEQFSLLFRWPQKVLLFFTQEIVDIKSERWSFVYYFKFWYSNSTEKHHE